EERVALTALEDALAQRLGQVLPTEELRHQCPASVLVERRKLDHLASPPARGGKRLTDFAHLPSCERDADYRCVLNPFDQMLDEIQEHRLTPMHVVEDDDQWVLPGEQLETATQCPEGLLGRRRLGDTENTRDPLRDARSLGRAWGERTELRP